MKSAIKPIVPLICSLFCSIVLLAGCGDENPISEVDVKEAVEENTKTAERKIPYDAYTILKEKYVENGGNSEDFNRELVEVLRTLYGDDPVRVDSVKVELPLKVSLYLDNTASMLGYIKPSNPQVPVTKFTEILTGIKDGFSGYAIDAYAIDKTDLKKYGTVNELIDGINSKNVSTGDAYQMSAFFGNVIDRMKSDKKHSHLAFFVTDAIPSGTNAQIDANPEYNIGQKSLLQSGIKDQFDKLRGKGYGAALFRFMVPFDGCYTNYKNNQGDTGKELHNALRPIYVIAVGNTNKLVDFAKDVEEGQYELFKPTHSLQAFQTIGEVELGVLADDESHYPIEIEATDENIYEMPFGYSNPQLTIELDNFPEYLRDEATLKSALVVKVDATMIDLKNNLKVIDGKARVKILFNSSATIKVTVKNVLPIWVQNFTSSNDVNITDPNECMKTFGLDVVVKGMLNGLYGYRTIDIAESDEITVNQL